MKYVRSVLDPGDFDIHPSYDAFADCDFVEDAKMIFWDFSGKERTTHMFYVRGDREKHAEVLENTPKIIEYDITPVNPDEYYVYLFLEDTEGQKKLFEMFSNNSLLVIPPMEHIEERKLSARVAGKEGDLQDAMESVPEGMSVEIQKIGEYYSHREGVLSSLTQRQLEALSAGVENGYYEIPREGSHEDIAEEMGCAPSTAAEHLRKAESKVISELVN